MAEINRDWEDKLNIEMKHSYLSVRVTQFIAAFMLLAGVIFSIAGVTIAGASTYVQFLGVGVSLIISSVPFYLVAQITEDTRKNRVATSSLLQLQMQQSLYLSEIKTILAKSVTYDERLLRIQTIQSRALNEIEALLAESTNDNERELTEKEVEEED